MSNASDVAFSIIILFKSCHQPGLWMLSPGSRFSPLSVNFRLQIRCSFLFAVAG